MFENIIGQPIIERIKDDITGGVFAPSVLFAGPACSGKFTAALELARILSCTENALWNCTCPSCAYHKTLSSSDLLIIGSRNFCAEIIAAKDAFLHDQNTPSTKIFFLRQIKKLVLRFGADITKDDPKISKLNPLLEIINEDMEELFFLANEQDNTDKKTADKIVKLSDKLVKNLIKLESDGISDTIPVLHIRNVSYWLRLKPSGKKKTLIIENADRMQDASRNSLLKILEEPPATAQIILTTEKPQTILPTLLSRLRPYQFSKRTAQAESEIIRRVFKDTSQIIQAENNLTSYLDKFLPVSPGTLYSLAAYFWSVVSSNSKKPCRTAIYELLALINAYCTPIASEGGFPTEDTQTKTAAAIILKASDNFSQRNSLNIFLAALCSLISKPLLSSKKYAEGIPLREAVLQCTEQTRIAYEIYKQNAAMAVDRLFTDLKISIERFD
ncbi:MAG: hypothetical protein Ta2F_01620 [Termitinemataceae bacterium]|nr:MAG: hypothetical protein Ta2F_01620 [Termitinemataceae bacterium]